MRETTIFLGASLKMMFRARGTLFLLAATPLTVLVYGLMRNLGWSLGPRTFSFVDFIVPGMAAFASTHILQDTMVAVAANYRARGVLRRIAVTPVSLVRLIGTQILAYVAFGVLVSILLLLVGTAAGAGVRIVPGLLWVVPLFVVMVATGLAFAFAIAGAVRSPQAANALSMLLGVPLSFLIGVTYPRQALPGPLPEITGWLPYSSLIEAIRGVALGTAPVGHFGGQIAVGVGWLLVALALAVRLYKFTED